MFKDSLKQLINIEYIEEELQICIIDKKVEETLKEAFELNYTEKVVFLDFLKKIKIFTFLTKNKIKYLNFINNDYSLFFSNFIFFVKNNGFTQNEYYKNKTIRITINVIKNLENLLGKSINIKIKPNLSTNRLNSERLKYLNGWNYDHKNLKSKYSLKLYKYSKIFGIEESNKIEYIINSIQQYRVEIPIFNDFFKYLYNNKLSIFNAMKIDILQDFMKKYFKEIIDNKKCLNSAKRQWNIFIKSLKGYFGLDKNLKLTLTREYKEPNKMNLKLVNGQLIKNKLITHVPLEISDDKALYILKEKINQDIDIIKNWAIFNLKNFDVDKNINKLPRRLEIYSIFILLTIDNPSITESFLSSLKNKNSYIKVDNNNYYLVGEKARRGNKLAEQKIKLNQFSINIIEKYIDWIKNIEKKEDSFFVYKGKKEINYITKMKSNSLYNESLKKSFKSYLLNMNFSNDYINSIFNNCYLSKIRATIAIKIYFETENTTKMSQALGHNSYNAKLLSHYLPQSILDFYQQRWIRIFQKGLICEALKNSDLLMIASNFENMEQLDLFLKNHMLKNIPDNFNSLSYNDNEKYFNNIFISINKDNLTALFSLTKAIQESKEKEKISEKAFFWYNFGSHLEKEILNNRDYKEFKNILTEAKEKSMSINFDKVIYE